MSDSSTQAKSTDWLFFLLSLVATILLLVFVTEWFWLGLPFMLTYLVRATGNM